MKLQLGLRFLFVEPAPLLPLLSAGARCLVRTELRREQPQRATQVTGRAWGTGENRTQPICCFWPLQLVPAETIRYTQVGYSGSRHSAALSYLSVPLCVMAQVLLTVVPALVRASHGTGSGRPVTKATALLQWGIEQLLKKHHPYLALEVSFRARNPWVCLASSGWASLFAWDRHVALAAADVLEASFECGCLC